MSNTLEPDRASARFFLSFLFLDEKWRSGLYFLSQWVLITYFCTGALFKRESMPKYIENRKAVRVYFPAWTANVQIYVNLFKWHQTNMITAIGIIGLKVALKWM